VQFLGWNVAVVDVIRITAMDGEEGVDNGRPAGVVVDGRETVGS
jgi:hypothetical protein